MVISSTEPHLQWKNVPRLDVLQLSRNQLWQPLSPCAGETPPSSAPCPTTLDVHLGDSSLACQQFSTLGSISCHPTTSNTHHRGPQASSPLLLAFMDHHLRLRSSVPPTGKFSLGLHPSPTNLRPDWTVTNPAHVQPPPACPAASSPPPWSCLRKGSVLLSLFLL